LRMADQAAHPPPQLEADLGDLGGLARAGLAGDDHDLVVPDGGPDLVTVLGDRKPFGVPDGGNGRAATLPLVGELAGEEVKSHEVP